MASRSDITVGPMEQQWHLVYELANEALTEILLLLLFLILSLVRPLRSLVESINCFDRFDHETALSVLAREDSASLAAPVSTASAIKPTISRTPAIPIAPKASATAPVAAPASASDSIRPTVSLNPLRVAPVSKSSLRPKPVVSVTPIPVPTPAPAPASASASAPVEAPVAALANASEKRSSIRPTVLLNSLRVVSVPKPSSRPKPVVSVTPILVPSSALAPAPVDAPAPAFKKKPSTRPIISLNALKVDSPPQSEFSEHLTEKQTWERLRTRIIQAREDSESLMRETEDYMRSRGYNDFLPSTSLPSVSPLSPYVPPHLRQDQKPSPPLSNPVPTIGPPYVTHMSIVKGCFYCHNKYVDKDGLFVRHRHRNKCPWFQYHLAVGTCHLNDLGELCLGPKLVGRQATPLPFWNAKISQGEQVKRRTDGTEYDEVLANRLRNPVVFKHY